MTAIGYGIIIALLMGLSAIATAVVVLKLKAVPNWQPLNNLFGGGDDEEEEEIMKAAQRRSEPTNYDESPGTAEIEMSKYKRRGAFEELKDATARRP